MQTLSRCRVVLFIVFLAIFTGIAQVEAARAKASLIASLLIMWTPGLAAIVVSFLTRRSLREIGWRAWPVKWLALGWLVPVVIGFAAYGSVWLIGAGVVPSPTFIQRARFTLHIPGGSDWHVIVLAFLYISLVNLLPSMVLSLGEEIGWRGFLVPEMTRSMGFRRASILSGVIWALWHLPGVLGGSYGGGDTPKLYQIACFCAMVITSGVIIAWLRMRSGSIWPAVIMHATHNGVIQAFFDRITINTGHTSYFIGEFGIALIPFMLIVAWLCWRRTDTIDAQFFAERSSAADSPIREIACPQP